MRATLHPHPASAAGPIRTMHVEIERDGLRLGLRYVAEGDPGLVAWPATEAPGRGDALWEHTCFEAFVSTDEGYREFNLSPSGQWASYGFSGYRAGMAEAAEVAVVEGLDGGADYVALEATVELPAGARRLALSAVIEAVDGTRTYWALAHLSDKPDFHHPDSFVLDLS
jgi:hypothetical protein